MKLLRRSVESSAPWLMINLCWASLNCSPQMRKKLEHRSKRDTWAERLEAAAHEGVSHDNAKYERVQGAETSSHYQHLYE